MRLKLGVLGVGHFGRFHALKAAGGGRTALAGVHDADPARAAAVAAECGAPAMGAEALIAASDAVIVAAPTAHHRALAGAALEAGRHVLVEKPVCATLAEADELIALAGRAGRVLQVGQLERFSAGMAALREEGGVTARIGRPVYGEAVRIAPYRARSLDVSAVLDLMIHDLDLMLTVFGAPLVGVDAVGSAVLSGRTDVCNARLRFGNGGVATLTASRVSLVMERRLRLFGTEGYLGMDFLGRTMEVVRRGAGEAVAEVPGFGAARSSWADRDSLEAEHASFARACLDGGPVEADGAGGRAALDAALRVEEAVAATRDAVAAAL